MLPAGTLNPTHDSGWIVEFQPTEFESKAPNPTTSVGGSFTSHLNKAGIERSTNFSLVGLQEVRRCYVGRT